MRLRDLTSDDLPRVRELNDDASPAVPVTSEADLAALIALSSLALVAVDDVDEVEGFLVAVDPGSDYASENYRWFAARGVDALYVDRIVVARDVRGTGVGRMLYDAVFARARRDGRAEVTCEVNLAPPNPESLAFHARLGFERVGEQPTKGGSVVVALLAARVDAGRHRPSTPS